MKKLTYLAGFLLLTTALFFAACSSSDDNPDLPPSISFVAGPGLLTGDATVPVNSQFYVKVLCEPNATSGAIIKTLRITRITNNQTFTDTTFQANNTPYTLPLIFTSLPDPTTENIEFTTTDKDGQSASISIQITTEQTSGGEIESFTMKVLGSYSSATGSSFASINGDVYTMQEAYNNQPIIDFLYWWGGSTDATVGAPDDANAQLVFTGTYGLQNWTVAKNATRFKLTTLTAAEFDAVTDATPCIDNASGADQTRIPNLVIGQVFGFLSVTGKHGLIKVDAINPEAAGDITIDVKVEK